MSPISATEPTVSRTDVKKWSNHHRGYTEKVEALFDIWNPRDGFVLDRYNATTNALLELIGRARDERVRVRAYGSGWSISKAPACRGWMLNTRPLDLYFFLAPSMVHRDYPKEADTLRFVQCGNSISKLNFVLKREHRSLRATGASNGQTIAGAAATGTHGSAIDGGTISDYVVGMHLILSDSRHVWLERASRPVSADEFASRLGAELVRDDALFDAALVGIGCFGMVHGAIIETEEIFLLDMFRSVRPLDDALGDVVRTLGFTDYDLPRRPKRPFHFEVRINPFDIDGGVYVTSMYREPFGRPYSPPEPSPLGAGDDLLAVIGQVTDWVPASIPLLSGLLALHHKEITDPVTGTIGEIFSDTTTPRKAAGTAIAVPTSRAMDALEIILDQVREVSFPGLVAFRFVPKSLATLAFTRFDRTCIIDVDGVISERTLALYDGIWTALRVAGIPHALHWGKLLPVDAGATRAMYGSALDEWRLARERLLDADGQRMFASRFTDALGLTG